MPMFDTGFFEWYINFVVEPLRPITSILCNNWGIEALWCMAAYDYAVKVLGYIKHTKTYI